MIEQYVMHMCVSVYVTSNKFNGSEQTVFYIHMIKYDEVYY